MNDMILTSVGVQALKAGQIRVAERRRYLNRLNWAAFALAFVTAIVIYGITNYDLTYAWYTNFPTVPDDGGGAYDAPVANSFANVPISVLSAVFLSLSALDHFMLALPLRSFYERNLTCNINPVRWIEYSLSASIMRVQIAMLSGILDIHLLWTLFGLTASTMIFGLVFERENGSRRLNGQRIRWTSFWAGFIPHMFGWLVILCYFFRSLTVNDPPGFVYAIIIVIFILDLTFAINLFFQWSIYKDYLKGEVAFIILSLTSKQLLAWLQFGGSQRK